MPILKPSLTSEVQRHWYLPCDFQKDQTTEGILWHCKIISAFPLKKCKRRFFYQKITVSVCCNMFIIIRSRMYVWYVDHNINIILAP